KENARIVRSDCRQLRDRCKSRMTLFREVVNVSKVPLHHNVDGGKPSRNMAQPERIDPKAMTLAQCCLNFRRRLDINPSFKIVNHHGGLQKKLYCGGSFGTSLLPTW